MPSHGSTVIPRADIRGAFYETTPQRRYIAQEIFSPVNVMAPTGRFGHVPMEALMLKPRSINRPTGAGYVRGSWVMEDDTFATLEYGYEEILDDRDEAVFASTFDLATVRAVRARGIYMRMREARAAALVQNTTTFPLSGNTGLDTSVVWTTGASATPIADVQAGIAGVRAQCGLTANTLQISWKTQYTLSRCTEIRNSRLYVEPVSGVLLADELARILGIERVIVADEMYDAGDESVSVTPTEVWSDSYAFVCVTSTSPDITEPCIGRSFVYHEDGSTGGEPTVEEYRADDIRSSVLRVRAEEQQKIIQAACGFLLKID